MNDEEMMNNPAFVRLLERYQQGKLEGKEKQFMDEWFEDMANGGVHHLWTSDDKQALKKSILSSIQADGKRTKFMQTRWVWRISASIAFVVAASYFGLKHNGVFDPQLLSQSSVSGEVNKVLLSDGSIVWLKNNSTLTYPQTFDQATRNVTLKGEALFEVAKDAKHPFIIRCEDLTTTVLGTSFNIRSQDNNVEVVVLTGKVSLSSATATNKKERSVLIVPKEKAVYSITKKQLATMAAKYEEEVAAVKGTEYDMHFEDTRMDEIIRRIEGKFSVHVLLANEKLGNCVVTANFTDQSLKKTLDILASVLSVEYEVNGETVTLSGKGCN